jgi:predicted deacetylase
LRQARKAGSASIRGRLLLAIHDVSPRFASEVDRLREHLGRHVPVERLALLVVPDHWGGAPLVPGSAFATHLRSWSDAGAEVFVHGYHHRDTVRHGTRLARFKAARMTAGEGEFLGLERRAAAALMARGQRLIEDVIGRPAAGFVAPAWLYGPGALEALADCGFDLAEDHWRIWRPEAGQVLARSPVLTWASRSRARTASSLLAARLLTPVLRHAPVARVGVHPADTTVPAIMASIDRAVGRLRRTHRPARYAELAIEESAPCVS